MRSLTASLAVFAVLTLAPRAPSEAPTGTEIKGKAPVFARVTKVDEAAGTFNYILLYDEIVNTERLTVDGKGQMIKKTADSVMTSRTIEKTDRPLKGIIISTGEGRVIPTKQALKELVGKTVLFCDDFDGLHPGFRKLLANDAWIIEVEKPGGLRKAEPPEAKK